MLNKLQSEFRRRTRYPESRKDLGLIKVIHKLRVYFLLFISLMFMIQLGLNPIDTGVFMGAKFGKAIGLEVSVPANPFNKLALQLNEKEAGLDEREEALNVREQALLVEKKEASNWPLWGMGTGIIILFFLVLTNFYLDFYNRLKAKKKSIA